MKKILLLLLCLLQFTIYSNNSIYEYIYKYSLLSSEEMDEDIYLQTFNTLSNKFILSEDYLDMVTTQVLDSGVDIYLINPDQLFSYNSAVAHSYDDGSMWQGKGINGKTSAGIYMKSDYFSFTLMPEFWFAENQETRMIETTSSSGYGDYWTDFDNLQRFGDDFYYDFDLGQTDLRFLYNDTYTIGISNQNIEVGPGEHNNIILGSQGAGFPHIDFGIIEPVSIFNIVDFEFRTIYGIVEESEYYDDDSSNDYGWYSGMSVGISPSIFSNFKIGLNHYYLKPLSEFDEGDFLRFIPGVDISNSATDNKDSVMSVTFDYIEPKIGLNIYGEYARNDQFHFPMGLWNEPEHSMAFTLGFSKDLYTFDNTNKLVILGEMTGLQQQSTFQHRAAGPWYRHSWAGWTQGYTNQGQLLGSTIGPGSNSQLLEFTYIHKKGMISLIAQRIAVDKDYYYYLWNNLDEEDQDRNEAEIKPQTEAIYAIESLYNFEMVDLFARAELNLHFNYNNVRVDDFTNIYLMVGASYNF